MTTTPQEALSKALRKLLDDAYDFGMPIEHPTYRQAESALAALSQQAAQEPQPDTFHDWAMRAIGTVMLKDDAAAELLAAELRALYAAAPAKPAEQEKACPNNYGFPHDYSLNNHGACAHCGHDAEAEQQAPSTAAQERLHTFLDVAAGEGFVLGGVDAGDLYAEVFPEKYAGALAHKGAQEGEKANG